MKSKIERRVKNEKRSYYGFFCSFNINLFCNELYFICCQSLSYAQTVKPRYSIEANTYTDLSINGGKASCYSFVEAEKVQKIVGKQTLQKQGFLWTWSTVSGATWTDKDSSNHLSMLHTKSGLSSGTYRIETVFTLTANDGKTETITVYSEEVAI